MLKRFSVILFIAALIAVMGACKNDKGGTAVLVFPVQVDGEATGFEASFIAYFPNEVQAHAGDEIEFTSHFGGEPHTVTLGTQVDDVFNVIAEACPNGMDDPACEEAVTTGQYADQYNAANEKLPELITEELDVPQAAAQPCFLATGDAPADGSACAADEMTQPDFDGTQTYYNSGWMDDQEVFSVKLSDDTAAGTYYYYCLLHREGMSGTITVVDEDTEVPSVEEVQQQADQALGEVITALQPAFDSLASFTADTAQAGAFSEDAPEAEVDEFGPKDLTIAAGASVTWALMGAHTVSFNAPESARPVLTRASDGTVSLNREAVDPQNSPAEPTPDENAPPPDEDAPPPTLDAGEWDGQGFHSSGLLFNTGAYKLTFTTAGTYAYICLIHPDMQGTVTVQ